MTEGLTYASTILVAVGFVGTLARWGRIALLAYVLGLTGMGWTWILRDLSLFSVCFAGVCWLYALGLIVLAGYEERKTYARKEQG